MRYTYIDTRLRTVSEPLPPKVETDHKCTVFVPWEKPEDTEKLNIESPATELVSGGSDGNAEVQFSKPPEEEMEALRLAAKNQHGCEEQSTEKEERKQPVEVEVEVEEAQAQVVVESNKEDAEPVELECPQIVEAEEETGEDDVKSMVYENVMLQVQQEELLQLGEELRRKIESERNEVERLKAEISELQTLYQYRRLSGDSSENTSEIDSSESEDEEELQQVLEDLIKENQELKRQNQELCEKIQQEREATTEVKVQIRLLQLKQEEILKQHISPDRETTVY